MAKLKPARKSKPSPANKNARRRKSVSTVPTALRGESLERALERFQSDPDEKIARAQWKQIESSVFGVEFED